MKGIPNDVVKNRTDNKKYNKKNEVQFDEKLFKLYEHMLNDKNIIVKRLFILLKLKYCKIIIIKYLTIILFSIY